MRGLSAVAVVVLALVLAACSGGSSAKSRTPAASPTPELAWTEDGHGNFHGVPAVPAGQMTTLPDGLQYLDLKTGSGDVPKEDEVVTVRWNGFLRTGGSFTGGERTMDFPLRRNATLAGLYEALLTMRTGGVRRVVLPPALAYGADGLQTSGGVVTIVPANATLVVDLELVSIAPANATPTGGAQG